MDVTSLLLVGSLLAQSAPLGNDRYATPPTAPTYSVPPSYTASPGYAAPPGDPIFTAAAEKKKPTATTTPTTKPDSATTPIPTPTPKNSATVAAPASSPPVAAAEDKSPAAELVREAVVMPKSLPLEGQATSLFEALSYVGDRRRQYEVVRTYWKLAAEAGEYHYAWQQTQFLEHLAKITSQKGDATTSTEIATRLATARAQLREAELELNDVQYELAEKSLLPANRARPLTVDLPHVGNYRTQFDKIFAGRTPPARAYLLNRTLPLRKQLVDTRSEGVWAAQDAYEAAFEAYQKNQLPVEEVLTALDDFRIRRGDFLAAVRRYNDEIAEYALTSAPDGITVATLVTMLIKNPTKPEGNLTGGVDEFGNPQFQQTELGQTIPVGFNEAMPSPQPTPDPISAQPTTVTPPSPPLVLPTAATPLPTNVIPQRFVAPAEAAPLKIPGNSLPAGPPAASPGGNPLRGQPTLAPSPALNSPYRVNKIPLEGPGAAASEQSPTNASPMMRASPKVDSAVDPAAYYPGLADLSAGRRAQELVESLYGTRSLPGEKSANVSLADCVNAAQPVERARVLSDYWTASEWAARYRAWTQASEQLEALSQATLRFNESPAKTAAMLRVRSAKLAAEAEKIAALAGLETARWQLTDDLRRPLAGAWVLPDTLPHGGGYKTKLEVLPASLAGSPQLQRPARRIPALHESLQHRAEAVVTADAVVESLASRYAAGKTTAHVALSAVERQARETEALLATTTRYNLTIGEYALAVLPPTAPGDMIVAAMVVPRNTVAGRP